MGLSLLFRIIMNYFPQWKGQDRRFPISIRSPQRKINAILDQNPFKENFKNASSKVNSRSQRPGFFPTLKKESSVMVNPFLNFENPFTLGIVQPKYEGYKAYANLRLDEPFEVEKEEKGGNSFRMESNKDIHYDIENGFSKLQPNLNSFGEFKEFQGFESVSKTKQPAKENIKSRPKPDSIRISGLQYFRYA